MQRCPIWLSIGAPAILNIYNEVTIHMVNSRVYSISLFINDLEENVHGQVVKFAKGNVMLQTALFLSV